MRYNSLANVDYILIDGRVSSNTLDGILVYCLHALRSHIGFHVVVLCSSLKRAREIDDLGDGSGQDLFFHGEWTESAEELDKLIQMAKLFIVPKNFIACRTSLELTTGKVPVFILIGREGRFYLPGASDDEFVNASISQVFSLLPNVEVEAGVPN